MKKAISFVLAALMLVSAVPTALATNDYTQGTQVVYTATGSESYTITVPAQLAPGGNGTVTLQGTWADNRIITVTAEPTVTLTNSIKAEDQKVLNVHFDGISEAGSNTGSQTFTEAVSVEGIENALFGTWNGKFNYNVEASEQSVGGCDTLYWDGNIEGKTIVQNDFVKISDAIYTISDVANGAIFALTEDGVLTEYPSEGDWFLDMGNGAVFQDDHSLVCIAEANTTIYTYTFEEPGVYLPIPYAQYAPILITIPGYTGFPHSEYCGH